MKRLKEILISLALVAVITASGVAIAATITHLLTMNSGATILAQDPAIVAVYDSDRATVLHDGGLHNWGSVGIGQTATWQVFVRNTGGTDILLTVTSSGLPAGMTITTIPEAGVPVPMGGMMQSFQIVLKVSTDTVFTGSTNIPISFDY
jgi:uncharacterized repeat protein (TIGR01451 family)